MCRNEANGYFGKFFFRTILSRFSEFSWQKKRKLRSGLQKNASLTFGMNKSCLSLKLFLNLGFVCQYLFFISSLSGIYTVYMNYMLKLACICSIYWHVTVIFPFLCWQYTDSSHEQRESKLVHLDQKECFYFIYRSVYSALRAQCALITSKP